MSRVCPSGRSSSTNAHVMIVGAVDAGLQPRTRYRALSKARTWKPSIAPGTAGKRSERGGAVRTAYLPKEHDGDRLWRSGRRLHFDQLHRTAKPHDENVDAAIHPADEWTLQEAGEPPTCARDS